MDTVLLVAIVLTTSAIFAQAVVLLGMYMLSRRVADDVNSLIDESRRIMIPLETIASNFRSTSDDLLEIGKTAREDLHRVEGMLKETADDVRDTILSPLHEWSAIAHGVAEGVRVFFWKRRPRVESREFRAA